MRVSMLIVSHELRALRDDSFINGMLNAPMHFHDNGFLHLRAGHDADLLLVVPRVLLRSWSFFCHHCPQEASSQKSEARRIFPAPKTCPTDFDSISLCFVLLWLSGFLSGFRLLLPASGF